MKAPRLLDKLLHRSGVMTYVPADSSRSATRDPIPRLRRLAQLVELHDKGGRVLDVGCWEGGLALALAPQLRSRYTGVDIAPAAQAVEAARSSIPEARFTLVESVEELPFSDASFDVVVLAELIEHIPAGKEQPLLSEAARILKRDGSIILSTPLDNVLNPLDIAWFFGHRHYTARRLARIARACSLETLDVEFTGGTFTLLDGIFYMIHKHVLQRAYMSPPWLKTRLEREGEAAPLGTLRGTLWCRFVRQSSGT